MLSIITANLLFFISAIVIGLATAWWVWGQSAADADEDPEVDVVDDTESAEPEPQTEPEVKEAPVAPVVAATATAAATPKAERAPRKPRAAADAEGKPKIAAAIGDPDDLKRVKGIGPKLESLCNSLGVTRFDQIAGWRVADVKEVDAHLGSFAGRITRDEWVAQAKLLAAGKVTQHAKRFGG